MATTRSSAFDPWLWALAGALATFGMLAMFSIGSPFLLAGVYLAGWLKGAGRSAPGMFLVGGGTLGAVFGWFWWFAPDCVGSVGNGVVDRCVEWAKPNPWPFAVSLAVVALGVGWFLASRVSARAGAG